MEIINGYEIVSDKMTTSSAVYWKARKNNEYFFLKLFNDPSRPSERINEKEARRRNEWCDRFEKERKAINGVIRNLGGGNFVAPVDFFLYKKRYYQATPWRDIKIKTIEEIVGLTDAEKLLILKTAANCLKLLHEKGIIHCDIKPDNLPVTVTRSNTLTCSLIDFDVSHIENEIPEPEEVYGVDTYWSPELAAYKMRKNFYGDTKFTVKNDVFALAIIFHYYWSGEDFIFQKTASRPFLYNAVFEGVPISVSEKIPKWLETILRKMIDKKPENRPTMGEVLEYLKQVQLQKPTDNVCTSEEKADEAKEEQNGGFKKGAKFPDDALSFEILPNGKVKFVYNDGSKMALNTDVAIKKQYITENNGG